MRKAGISSAAQFLMLISLGRRTVRSWEQPALAARTGPLLDEMKHGGNEENAKEARSQHASDDGCTHNLASYSSRSGSGPQRDGTQDECERSHQDRAKPQPSPLKSLLRQRFALFVLLLRNLHDQDCVLRRQANQHHQADL